MNTLLVILGVIGLTLAAAFVVFMVSLFVMLGIAAYKDLVR